MSTSNIRKYLREQPQKPTGIQNRIPILISDSKGFTLRNNCPDFTFPFELWCIPGARTTQLVDIVKNRIEKAIIRHKRIVIYFWSRTCDLTEKTGKYIRLRNKTLKTVDNIIQEHQRLLNYVEKFGSEVTITIVDCPLLSIQKWNSHFKPNKRTSKTKIEEDINEDKILTKQLSILNKKIWELNIKIGNKPIKTSQFYFRTRGNKRKPCRHSVKISLNTQDGVHPGKLICLKITKLLLLDSYKQCYTSVPSEEILQVLVEEKELLTLA